MLRFNPSFRLTAAECLQHKVFDKLRVPQREKPSANSVNLQIYAEGSYDYEECVSVAANTKDFKRMILEEVQIIKAALIPQNPKIQNSRLRALSPQSNATGMMSPMASSQYSNIGKAVHTRTTSKTMSRYVTGKLKTSNR